MPVLKVISTAGNELIAGARVEPGETLRRLCSEAAAVLGARGCKLATQDHRALSGTTKVEESGLQDGDTVVAAALSVSEMLLRIAELLTEHYRLRCQAAHGECLAATSDRNAAAAQDKFKNDREIFERLRQLPEQFDPSLEGGQRSVEALEAKLCERAERQLPLPPGLAEFVEINAWLASFRQAEAGTAKGKGKDKGKGEEKGAAKGGDGAQGKGKGEGKSKGEDNGNGKGKGKGGKGEAPGMEYSIPLGDLDVEPASNVFCSSSTPGGVLAELASNAYNDDVDLLCIEWRDGQEPRYVAFHHWDEDSIDTFEYSFSDAVPGPTTGSLDLMANEGPMGETTARRVGIYANFLDVLEALNAEMLQRMEDPRLEASSSFFLMVSGYGLWLDWDRDLQL